MKIDVFSHFFPRKSFDRLCERAHTGTDFAQVAPWISGNAAMLDADVRARAMRRYPDVLQVLTTGLPALDDGLVSARDAIELAKFTNDELAETVEKYPDKFVTAVACLPLNDIDAALKEAERAITQLGLRGVQVFTTNNGQPPDAPQFKPLYELMAQYDLPIWIHPTDSSMRLDRAGSRMARILGWPVETTIAMVRLVQGGIFQDYPDIKFITHHCGAMVPFFERRLHLDQLRGFYNDSAIGGSTAALMCGYAYFGADRLLFGTDMPLGAPAGPGGAQRGQYGLTQETIRSIERMEITEAEKDKIFEGNATRLLKLWF